MSLFTEFAAKTDYPFLNIVWTLLIIFAWVIWFFLLITVFSDLFRRRDIGGGSKALWMIFVIVLPYLGVLIYFITQGNNMAERNMERARAMQADTDAYIQSVAGGGAAEIERAKGLLDSGAITQAEFEQIKAKALG